MRTWSPVALDQHVLTLAKQLHLHAAALGRSAEQLHRVEAWRHLGFASQGHYARDRLGVSLSSLKQKRALARRLVALPRLAHALEVGQLGSVAASLVARVATSKTERRWVERARQRTVKHLREEVAFVERIQRSRPGHPSWPPSPEVMRAELALQGSIVNGQLLSEPARPSEHRSPSGPLANSDSRSGVSSESPASESPASESPASEGVRQHPVRRDAAAAAQRRQYQNQIRDYSIGVDAGCSPQHRSHLLPSNAQRPSPSTVIDDRAMHRSCSGPHQLDNCAAADSTARAPSSVAAPGQTSVGENPAKSAATAPQQWPRQCTADPTCTPRGRHPHLTGDGLGIGRTRLRLRVYEWTLLLYREVARAFARQYPTRRLLRGLCEHFLAVWRPVVAREPEHKYGHIYERDNYTCTSPVCDRHDVTPHHLRFRSRGGGDEPENLASLCVWCHLEGVHGGRLRAEPLPGGIRWTIGRVAPMRVVDRDKVETR